MFRRTLANAVCVTALAVTVTAAPAAATPTTPLPGTITLPSGFQPEGIAIGGRPFAYFGSRVDGDIYRVDLRTGAGATFSEGPGTASLGLKIDDGRLFVAGGAGGDARILDLRTGAVLKSYQLQPVGSNTFINDVIVTDEAAWFTDSRNLVLFKVPFGRHGRLPAAATAVPLTGDIQLRTGNNANGISTTPDGRGLIIVQSNTGFLFRVSTTGVTSRIDVGDTLVTNGDGLWLRGRDLYVVQNRLNQIAEIKLNRSATAGRLESVTTDPSFDVPTTIAEYGKRFYLPNARFTTPPTPETTYNAVAVPIP
ncbi:superoxide dismutase [Actinoplanes sp. NEAU-A12]|uniref:Superoxide dismutase n=1 Tax=Actinoplanes sandaracinus TaxID=3045177 RepID=A0ABT6WEI4_9ACTN|nr:superoxide dismutase [Actinoplanes sandaracinus]MDI6098139.1 superoxide dismutase [Actinoplanes sandaracinus]